MTKQSTKKYPAKLDIDYPKKLNRLTTFFRVILVIPILLIYSILTGTGGAVETTNNTTNEEVAMSSGGIVVGLMIVIALMILFRKRYPRWWYDFLLELNRFSMRVSAYLLLLTDKYPSTVDRQSVRLELEYPNVNKDLQRGMPLIKWLLALPHYIVLVFLVIGAIFATLIAWFAILFTGRYPKPLFDYVVGVSRWGLRVSAYTTLLITDEYPPFSLK